MLGNEPYSSFLGKVRPWEILEISVSCQRYRTASLPIFVVWVFYHFLTGAFKRLNFRVASRYRLAFIRVLAFLTVRQSFPKIASDRKCTTLSVFSCGSPHCVWTRFELFGSVYGTFVVRNYIKLAYCWASREWFSEVHSNKHQAGHGRFRSH